MLNASTLRAALPIQLRNTARAVLWNREVRHGDPKPTKVPYSPSHPAQRAAVDNPSTWAAMDVAIAAFEDGKGDGVGVVLGEGLVGVDIDSCRDPESGELTPEARDIVSRLASYTEVSPSGTGIHVLLRGTLPAGGRRRGNVEMYSDHRYFTLTGDHVPGTPATIEERTDAITRLHAERFPPAARPPAHRSMPTQVDLDDRTLLDRAAAARNGGAFSSLFDGNIGAYGDDHSAADLALCNLLCFWAAGDARRIDRLFRQSSLYRPKWDEQRGDQTYGELTITKAIASCKELYRGEGPPGYVVSPSSARITTDDDLTSADVSRDDEPLVLDPTHPLPSARAFVQRRHTVGGELAMRHQSGVFYTYDDSVHAYAERDEAAVRADLYLLLEQAGRVGEKGRIEPFKPTKAKVENVLDAVRAVTNLPSAYAAPCWLDGAHNGIDPHNLLPVANGLLHLPTRELYDGTPRLFALNALDFRYDVDALAPAWARFLNSLWPNDPESVGALQEWLGYLLTPRTDQQKMLLVVGPKRSGKGTIARVTRLLLGSRNVCGPTLANMGEQFGLSILINKTAAIIADARLSGKTDTSIVTERLLSISGEDALSIPRKFLADWTGKLTTRFMLLTNELPRIEDASGALASRFLVLALHQSFYGREDHSLVEQFKPELPGILNWAIDGLFRLTARGRFVQPTASTELIQQFEDLGSPISAFIRDCCDVGRGHEVPQTALYEAWKVWCRESGRERAGSIQTFGRNLRAAVPWLGETRPHVLTTRIRYYSGIRLQPEGQ